MRGERREIPVKFWVNSAELAAIDAGAEFNSVSRGEYCRSRTIGRPLKAQKPLYKAQQATERKRLREAAEAQAQQEREAEEAAERERVAEIKRDFAAKQKRRQEAERLAKGAGGAEKMACGHVSGRS